MTTVCPVMSAASRMEAFCSFMLSSSFEELDGGAFAPEVQVLERAVGLDQRPPHRVRVLMVDARKPRGGPDAETQVGQALERVHECVRVERPFVRFESSDEHARGNVALERGERGRKV